MDEYTTTPTHIRITQDSGDWLVDAVDESGKWTDQCWTYDSFSEALKDVPDFVSNLESSGHVFNWRKIR